MFEFLLKIIDLLPRAVAQWQQRGGARRKKEFGVALLTTYLRLLEVVDAGRQLLDELQFFAERWEAYLAKGEVFPYFDRRLREILEKQSVNIDRLGHALRPIAEELRVIAPDTAVALATLIRGKKSAVLTISRLLQAGRLPVLWSTIDPPAEMRVAILRAHGFEGVATEAGNDSALVSIATDMIRHTEVTYDTLDTGSEWGEDAYRKVREHFANPAALERLGQLESCAGELRAVLLETFSFDDILWSVATFKDRTQEPF